MHFSVYLYSKSSYTTGPKRRKGDKQKCSEKKYYKERLQQALQ